METAGKDMHDAGTETRREAARALGQARTPAKAKAARENAAARKGIPLSEEHKEKIRVAQAARWAAARAERAAMEANAPPVEKKQAGRPPKPVDPNAPKRPRGRPRKEPIQTTGESG